MIELMSYYRDAELQGAALLLRLIKMIDDPDAQVELPWSGGRKPTTPGCGPVPRQELDGEPMKHPDGYQKRVGLRRFRGR